MKHLKYFKENKGYNDIDFVKLKAKFKKMLQKYLKNVNDIISSFDYIDHLLEFFETEIGKDKNWDEVAIALHDALDDYLKDSSNFYEDCFDFILSYLEDNPTFFSKQLDDLNKKTGLFEAVNFENNKTGTIHKIKEDFIKNEIEKLMIEKICEFFQLHDLECEYVGTLSTPQKTKRMPLFNVGGVKLVLEDDDHLRLWANSPAVNYALSDYNLSTFHNMLDFVNVYKKNNIQLYVNEKTKDVAKLGVFEKRIKQYDNFRTI